MTNTSSEPQSSGARPSAPLSTESVREELAKSLSDLGIDAELVVDGARLREDLELDSTEVVQVSLDLTRHTGKKVKLESGTDYSIAEICELVTRLPTPPPGDDR